MQRFVANYTLNIWDVTSDERGGILRNRWGPAGGCRLLCSPRGGPSIARGSSPERILLRLNLTANGKIFPYGAYCSPVAPRRVRCSHSRSNGNWAESRRRSVVFQPTFPRRRKIEHRERARGLLGRKPASGTVTQVHGWPA